MFKKTILALAVLTVFMATNALAANECKKGKFAGSYTLANPNVDVIGDGSIIHSFLFQLTLNADGTANSYWTGLNDYFINLGTGSPSIGSWSCRNDGKVIVTLISATYLPAQPNGNTPNPDVTLFRHTRSTLLFNIVDDNTITREQGRSRVYNPSQDPTDPNGGTLLALNTTQITYNRLIATDADLLAP
jgi:hypothetical protein